MYIGIAIFVFTICYILNFLTITFVKDKGERVYLLLLIKVPKLWNHVAYFCIVAFLILLYWR